MDAYKANGLPLDRLMVGTGAAAVSDAVALTRHAADLGFAGALVLPPFYYKGVPDDGLVAYIDALVKATAQKPIPIYLYHFPAMSGLPWHVTLIKRLLETFPTRIVGLKDSSGDMAYRTLGRGVSSRLCGLPFDRSVPDRGTVAALSRAASRRPPISTPICAHAPGARATPPHSKPLSRSANCSTASRWSPGVKALLAHIHGDAGLARVRPPLAPFSAADRAVVIAGHDAVRAKRVA